MTYSFHSWYTASFSQPNIPPMLIFQRVFLRILEGRHVQFWCGWHSFEPEQRYLFWEVGQSAAQPLTASNQNEDCHSYAYMKVAPSPASKVKSQLKFCDIHYITNMGWNPDFSITICHNPGEKGNQWGMILPFNITITDFPPKTLKAGYRADCTMGGAAEELDCCRFQRLPSAGICPLSSFVGILKTGWAELNITEISVRARWTCHHPDSLGCRKQWGSKLGLLAWNHAV